MGVNNLLEFVKSSTHSCKLERTGLPNSTAAVDISHWIYRASYACPEVLYHRTQLQEAYRIIINYIDTYVQLLKSHNVKLTFVFDGMKLPAKRVTHDERSARKAESRRMVEVMLARGNKSEARKYMLRCIDMKFDVIEQVIKYCEKQEINYIVAPYEADAQCAYLCNTGICDYVITEDTDLILYGCKKIIYKLDRDTGHCLFYEKTKLNKCFGPKGDDVSFEKFRRICILSGCDYLKNIPGVGLQSARKFFLMTKQDNVNTLLPKLSTYLNSAKLAGKMNDTYIQGFIVAETTFKHHIVYDPLKEQLVPIEPYPRGKSSKDFPAAGKRFHRVMAKDLVSGKINLDLVDPDNLDSASDDSDIENDEEENESRNSIEVPQKMAAAV